ncbi:MAG TPA: hypothetical protein VG889_13520 [Rhizomicrobium sp.]|nr:hypothetical protein [Rhizomicrobium sp.]
MLAAVLLSAQMRGGIAAARFVPPYSQHARAAAVRTLLHLSAAPTLKTIASLSPNRPHSHGAHLSFWKTSFVLGTASGGEAGVNFWNIHDEGHINVGFRARRTTILDCRLIASGPVTYKVYAGPDGAPRAQSDETLKDGHLVISVRAMGDVSVELWPKPVDATMGFLGCDLVEPAP